jgi:hypothetical protein
MEETMKTMILVLLTTVGSVSSATNGTGGMGGGITCVPGGNEIITCADGGGNEGLTVQETNSPAETNFDAAFAAVNHGLMINGAGTNGSAAEVHSIRVLGQTTNGDFIIGVNNSDVQVVVSIQSLATNLVLMDAFVKSISSGGWVPVP